MSKAIKDATALAKESGGTKRVNVSFGPKYSTMLETLSTTSGTTKADVIREAIAFRSWMTAVQDKGGRLLVERKAGSGELAEIVKP